MLSTVPCSVQPVVPQRPDARAFRFTPRPSGPVPVKQFEVSVKPEMLCR